MYRTLRCLLLFFACCFTFPLQGTALEQRQAQIEEMKQYALEHYGHCCDETHFCCCLLPALCARYGLDEEDPCCSPRAFYSWASALGLTALLSPIPYSIPAAGLCMGSAWLMNGTLGRRSQRFALAGGCCGDKLMVSVWDRLQTDCSCPCGICCLMYGRMEMIEAIKRKKEDFLAESIERFAFNAPNSSKMK